MKKLFLLLFAIVAAPLSVSCTQNEMARRFGSDISVQIPEGETVQCATWKETTLWLTTVDTLGVVRFREHNSLGWKSGTVMFK